MQTTLQKQFQKNNQNNHREDTALEDKIWQDLTGRISERYRWQLRTYRTISILSILCFVPAIKMLAVETSTSGFLQYFSLVFSHAALAGSIKELTFVLIESLPVTSVIVCLVLFFIFVSTLRISFQKNYPLNLASAA